MKHLKTEKPIHLIVSRYLSCDLIKIVYSKAVLKHERGNLNHEEEDIRNKS